MKRIIGIMLILSIAFGVLASCQSKKMEEQIRIEREQKEAAQREAYAAKQQAAEVKSQFNLLVGLSIAAIVIILIVGIALGSKARKASKRKRLDLEAEDEE